jgi:hypothetical protein
MKVRIDPLLKLVLGSLDKFDYISTFQPSPWQRHSISTGRKTPAILKSVVQASDRSSTFSIAGPIPKNYY